MTFKLEVAAVEPDFEIRSGVLTAGGVEVDASWVTRTPVAPGAEIAYACTIKNNGGIGTADVWLMSKTTEWGSSWTVEPDSHATKSIAAGASEQVAKIHAAIAQNVDMDYKIWVGIGSDMHDELGCGELESEEGQFGL